MDYYLAAFRFAEESQSGGKSRIPYSLPFGDVVAVLLEKADLAPGSFDLPFQELSYHFVWQ